jgi:hypothetical protein
MIVSFWSHNQPLRSAGGLSLTATEKAATIATDINDPSPDNGCSADSSIKRNHSAVEIVPARRAVPLCGATP